MNAVYLIFFDTSHWTGRTVEEEKAGLQACASVYTIIFEFIHPTPDSAIFICAKFEGRVLKRLVDVLFSDAYGDGEFPYLYMRMVTSFFDCFELAALFTFQGLPLVLVKRTWLGIRSGEDRIHNPARICVKVLYM